MLVAVCDASQAGVAASPFRPRSTGGATLFTRVPAESTRIQCVNTYADPSMWGDRYEPFALGSCGTGVAVGDFDGDGLPDIFIVNKCDPDRLYRNLGGFRFEDVTEKAGIAAPQDGAWKQAASFVDIDNDGRLDLAVTRLGAPNLLFMNQGNGTFREEGAQRGFALSDASGVAAFADYDRDGWLDCYVQTNLLDANSGQKGRRDRMLHNRGDGTFEEVTERCGIAGETQGHSALWWDFDNDGWQDLYVANDFAQPDMLYRNNRDGTFTDVLAETLPHCPLFAMGSDSADLANRGLEDLMVADMVPSSHRDDLRTMAEMRRKQVELPNPAWPVQLIHNAVYLNTGTGRFDEVANLCGLAATDWTWSVRFEDLDQDGWVDVHVTNGMVRDFFDADLLARCATLTRPEQKRAIQKAPVLRSRNLAFRNHGDLRFEEVGAAWGLDELGVSFGAAIGDFDGDGDLDLVYSNYEAAPTVLRNDGRTGNAIRFALRGTHSNRFGLGTRVEVTSASGTRVRTLVSSRGYLSSSEPVLHFGLGADAAVEQVRLRWPDGKVQVLGRLAANQTYTITEPETPAKSPVETKQETRFEDVSARLGVELSVPRDDSPEFSAQPLLPFRQNRFGPGLAVADLDGDGREDLVVGGAAGQAPVLLMRTETGEFAPKPLADRADWPAEGAPLLFDVEGDGRCDLFLPKGEAAKSSDPERLRPSLVMNRGAGRFKQAPAAALPPWAVPTGPAVAADFDGDGRLDLFLGGRTVPGAYGEPASSALWLYRDSGYKDVTAAAAPGLGQAGMVAGALATDFDGDGHVDLLLARQWGTVQAWRNRGDGTLEDVSEKLGFSAAGNGLWNSVAAADFNGDGRVDYVVGNLGLNTPYRASPAQPFRLERIETPSRGTLLFESIATESGRIPWRARGTVAAAEPALLRRTPTYRAYAGAEAGALVAELGRSLGTLELTELRTGVFLSQPQGGFAFRPLPRAAQAFPVYGVVAGDADGDGHADLVLVGNSYAPNPEIGRFDGGVGLFLRGDGQGAFDAVEPRQSGFSVPGDAKALVRLDLDGDGWPDLAGTRAGGTCFAFRVKPVAGRTIQGVQFRLKKGGAAVGALVTARHQSGLTQTLESALGGGYLSQNSAELFFGALASDPILALEVRWPDGSRSQVETAGGRLPRAVTQP